jgi:hypothetical protein
MTPRLLTPHPRATPIQTSWVPSQSLNQASGPSPKVRSLLLPPPLTSRAAQWLDRSVDSLAKRPARPHLQIILKDSDGPSIVPSGSNSYFSSDQLHSMITLARSCGLQPDCYPLTITAINSKKRSLRLFQKSPGQELGSTDLLLTSSDPSTSPASGSEHLSDGCLGYRCCGVRLSVDPKDVPNPSLFAILCPFPGSATASEGKRADLLVFPYNFPQLLPLLQQAKEICSRIGGPGNLSMVANSPTSLPQTWQPQMGAYLRSVPSYYYPCLYKSFKTLGLHVFFSLLIGSATSSPPPADISLSRPCMRQLTQVAQKAKADLCLIDPSEAMLDNTVSLTSPGPALLAPSPASASVASLGDQTQQHEQQHQAEVDPSLLEYNIANHRGPIYLQRSLHWKNPSSLLALGISSSAHHRHFPHSSAASGGTVAAAPSLYHPAIPHLGGQPPASQDLLYTWEKIRSTVYGGTGVTVRGLYVAGLHGSSSGSHLQRDSQHQPDWFFKACGGSSVPRLSIACMSDYVSILSRKEVLRDPELLSPPQDEDQPQGILKRKLAVNFGSPYKPRKQRTNSGHGNGNGGSNGSGDSRGGREGDNSSSSPLLLVSDEPAALLTDDIFNLPSPDSGGGVDHDQHPQDSHSNEAFVAFSAPSSPLILLGDTATSATAEGGGGVGALPLSTTEMKSLPRLKLKGRKTFRPPPLSASVSRAVPAPQAEGEAGHSKNVSGIAFPVPWMPSSPLSSPPSPVSSPVPAQQQQQSPIPKPSPASPVPSPVSPSVSSQSSVTAASVPAAALPVSLSSGVSGGETQTSGAGGGGGGPWIKRFSEKHRCDYWFNTISGVSQWTPPSSSQDSASI